MSAEDVSGTSDSSLQCILESSLTSSLLESSSSSLLLVAGGVLAVILALLKLQDMKLLYHLSLWLEYFFVSVPSIEVDLTDTEQGKLEAFKKDAPKSTELVDPNRPGFLQCFSPATGDYLGQVPIMTPEQVHQVCVKAANAQKEWCQTTFAQRRTVLRTIQKYIVQHTKDICRVSALDSGKPEIDAMMGEVLTTCEKIRTIVADGELWLQPSYRNTGPMMMYKTAYVQYVPLGVIGTIAPWNYPFHNMLNHIISGIFSGNAVVGKVSEHSSWCAAYFGRIVQQALIVNGHNPDLVQTVTGLGDAGAALVSDPLIEKVIFTGSPAIGRKVMETASKYLKDVIIEAGGKDPMVITDDVDLASVYPMVMRGVYQNCGQNCCNAERIFVYDSVYDQFLKEITPKVQALRQGNPLGDCRVDLGAMVMERQLDIIQELVDDAVQNGAKVLAGGKRNTNQSGQFYEPTIVADVTPDMRLFQEEIFGPVMTVIRVPNDSDEACVKMVNDSCYGLNSSVYSKDKKRALAIGNQFRTGMMAVNDFGSNYLVQSLPFGGTKDSGFGRFAGIEGLRALCLERSIVVDALPFVKTTIPPSLDYPMQDKSFGFCDSLFHLFYAEGLLLKLKGIFGLIKNG